MKLATYVSLGAVAAGSISIPSITVFSDSLATVSPEKNQSTSWLAQELDYNQPFIDGTIKAVGKPEEEIQLVDLQAIKDLQVYGASEIPNKISDYSSLENLGVVHGTVSEIPEGLFELHETLRYLSLKSNRFITLPERLFDDSLWEKNLVLLIEDNQILSDVPSNTFAAAMLNFNSRNNMLEHFNKDDYHNNPQAQLSYQGGRPTITVPIGYDFKEQLPDTTNLKLYIKDKGYIDLFPGHEFIYYDEGTSSVLENGVTTKSGRGTIAVKSKFSTDTNRFAKTLVNVVVEKTLGQKVIVNYEDTDGNQIANSESTPGYIGDYYDISYKRKTIQGYTFKEVKGNETGTFTDKEQVVTYVYTKDTVKAQDVVVKYEDTEGNAISESIRFSGNVGESYDVSGRQRRFTGYTFKEVTGDVKGTFSETEQVVTYVYTKNPEKSKGVLVRYEDTEGNEIGASKKITGNIGESYDAYEYHETIKGYTFKEIKGDVTGTLTDTEQMVTYVYTKNPVKAQDVIVKYQDPSGKEIATDQVIAGNIGESYDASGKEYQRTIDGYTFKEVKGNVTGTLSDQSQVVIYVYTKDPIKAQDLIVKYEDTKGNEIAASQSVSGNIGDSYDVSDYQQDIDGYTFSVVRGNVTGKLSAKAQVVTYVYTKNPEKAQDVVVRYEDTEGNEILEPVTISGNIGDNYDVARFKQSIKGYTFKEVQGKLSGTLSDQEQIVKYVYTKNPVRAQAVIVRYEDTEGNEIAPYHGITGIIGDSYDASDYQKTIQGYTFKEIKGNVTGTLSDQEQIVTYVYTKDPVQAQDVIVRYEDITGTEIAAAQSISGYVGYNYDASTYELAIEGYTLKEVKGNVTGTLSNQKQVVTYVYTKNPVQGQDVVVKYFDTEGNELAAAQRISGNIGENYDVTGSAYELTFDGYTLNEIQGTTAGTFSEVEQIVTYVYKKVVEPQTEGEIKVVYLDENGGEIHEALVLHDTIGESFVVSAIEIPGYELNTMQSPTEHAGTYTAETQTFTFVYTKVNPVVYGNITVQYLNKETHEELSPAMTLQGEVGAEFNVTALEINGYRFDGEASDALNGLYSQEDQVITLYYTLDDSTGESGNTEDSSNENGTNTDDSTNEGDSNNDNSSDENGTNTDDSTNENESDTGNSLDENGSNTDNSSNEDQSNTTDSNTSTENEATTTDSSNEKEENKKPSPSDDDANQKLPQLGEMSTTNMTLIGLIFMILALFGFGYSKKKKSKAE